MMPTGDPMMINSATHSLACIAVRGYLKTHGYRYRSNLATMSPGRADLTVWGTGACVLELELKTGKGKQSEAQRAEQIALDKRLALYRVATVNKDGNRYDMAQVADALRELDRLNALLLGMKQTKDAQ
jgi:hypothetical protein